MGNSYSNTLKPAESIIPNIQHNIHKRERNKELVKLKKEQEEIAKEKENIRMEKLQNKNLDKLLQYIRNDINSKLQNAHKHHIEIQPKIYYNKIRTLLGDIIFSKDKCVEIFHIYIEPELLKNNYDIHIHDDKCYTIYIPYTVPKIPIPDSCSVCHELFESNTQIKILLCHHAYHVSCIDKWSDIHSKCPLCKRHIHKSYSRIIDYDNK